MKLKLSLKNSVKSALLFNILLAVFFYGCDTKFEPTYKESDIPDVVKKICKEEYSMDVTTVRTPSTLWIYAPLSKLLHKEFGVSEDKIFDEEMADKSRNILTTAGRVLISSDNAPLFFVFVACDINLGIDCIIIGNTLDMKKSYAGFIPWTESSKRYVIRFSLEPQAVGDVTGKHLKTYDITLQDFLSLQIAQRIASQFQGETIKKYFKLEKSEGRFENGLFLFEYLVSLTSNPPKGIDLQAEALKTITYCLKTYEFTNFSGIEINNLFDRNRLVLSKEEIWTRPLD